MALVWLTGYESNDLIALPMGAGYTTLNTLVTTGDGGSVAVQSGTVRTGTYALNVACTSASDSIASVGYEIPAAAYARFYFYTAALPTTAQQVASYTEDFGKSFTYLFLVLKSDGILELLQGTDPTTATTVATGATAVTTSAWHRIDFDIPTDATAVVKLDGAAQISTAITALTGGTTYLTMGSVVGNADATAYSFYYDDLYVDNTAEPPDGGTVFILPNATGTDQDWASLYPGTTTTANAYTLINGLPPFDFYDGVFHVPATYIELNSTGNVTVSHSFSDTGSVNLLGVLAIAEPLYTGGAPYLYANQRLRYGSHTYNASDDTSFNGGNFYIWDTNPLTGLGWETSDLGSIETGLNVVTGGGSTLTWAGQYIVLDYNSTGSSGFNPIAPIAVTNVVTTAPTVTMDEPSVTAGIAVVNVETFNAYPRLGDSSAFCWPSPAIVRVKTFPASTIFIGACEAQAGCAIVHVRASTTGLLAVAGMAVVDVSTSSPTNTTTLGVTPPHAVVHVATLPVTVSLGAVTATAPIAIVNVTTSPVRVVTAPFVYFIYANDGTVGGMIDYHTSVGFVTGTTWTTPALTTPGYHRFGVRAFDAVRGYEELNVDSLYTLELDASGNDITGRPHSPSLISVRGGGSGALFVSWAFAPCGRPNPTRFNIYVYEDGSSLPGTPTATLPYIGNSAYGETITGLTAGTLYTVVVTSSNTVGESGLTRSITGQTPTSPPLMPAVASS